MSSRSTGVVISLVFWTLLIAIVSVGYGFIAYKYKLFPYTLFSQAYQVIDSLVQRPHHLYPIRYEGAGLRSSVSEMVYPGQTLVTSYWKDLDWGAGAKLLAVDGSILHSWAVDASQLQPKSVHKDSIAGSKNRRSNYIHGAHLLENGDLVFNIEYLGLFRINSCGEKIWQVPYRTHHSIHPDGKGNYWVSGMVWVDRGSPRAANFPGLTPPFAEDTAILVSADGKILKEVSLLGAIFNSPYKDIFWKMRRRTDDVSHLNDVEPLTNEMASAFPDYEVGDLLVSFKEISLVAIIGQEEKVKLFETNAFNNQHDPDFEPSGVITVFDNRADGTDKGNYLGGSKIVSYDPRKDSTEVLFPVESPSYDKFYTNTGGKHQLLPNGNRLVTEANAGRVFELDAGGSVVWDWVQEPFDNKFLPEVLEGTRYQIDPETIQSWECNSQ